MTNNPGVQATADCHYDRAVALNDAYEDTLTTIAVALGLPPSHSENREFRATVEAAFTAGMSFERAHPLAGSAR